MSPVLTAPRRKRRPTEDPEHVHVWCEQEQRERIGGVWFVIDVCRERCPTRRVCGLRRARRG